MGAVAACLIDVYETAVSSDFGAHTAALLVMAGVPAGEFRAAFVARFPAVSDGRLSLEEAFASAIEQCGGEPHPALVRDLVRRDRELLIESARLHDDVVPFLDLLRRRGIPAAFVSNCAPSTRPLLAHLGLITRVDAVVLSCEVGCDKPGPAIYEAALDLLGVPAGRSLFVDDQPAYCEGAVALGIRAVRIARDGAAGATDGVPVVRSLADLEPFLA